MSVVDLTTWTEADPNSRLTVTSTSITINDEQRNDDGTWVTKDYGANYFGGDYAIRLEFTTPALGDQDAGAWIYPLCLTNVLNELDTIESSGGDVQGIIFLTGSDIPRMPLFKVEAGTRTTTYPPNLSFSTKYYITLERDDDGGANSTGQLTLRVYTGNYYGETGAVSHGTVTLDCNAGEQNDFRHVMLSVPRGSGTEATDGLIENVDPEYSSGVVYERSAIISGTGSFAVDKTVKFTKSDITISGQGSFSVVAQVSNIFSLGTTFPGISHVVQPGWENDSDPGVQWDTPSPTEVEGLVTGGDAQRSSETPVRQASFDGVVGPIAVEAPWYEAAHLLPRLLQDVGNVITEQQILCELYNADRKEQITVASVTNDLGTGFTVVGVPATPFNIASQDGLSFQIKVLQSGDLTIDGSYTLTLSTGETYTITVIGSRIVLLPIRPEAPLREHLIFETKIIEHVDASEQRIKNREYPRSEFEMKFKGDNRKRLELLLFDRQSKVVAVPSWHEPSFLSAATASGVDTITVNTTDYANFFVGGYAVIFQDEYTFDALKIEAITGTTLQFSSDLTNSFAKNAQVMPLVTAYVAPTTPMVKAVINDQDFDVKLRVNATENPIASAAAFSTYNGKVFLDDPNLMESSLREALETKVYVLDNSTGNMSQFAVWDHALRNSRKGFKTNNRQELWELRQLFHYLKGRQVSFYIPTFSKDLVPNQTLLNANSTFTMDSIGYTINANNRWPKQVFRMHLKDGTILTRTIQGSAEVSTSVEQLTVDTVWPYDIEPDDIERVEFLEKVRLNTDDIVIVHNSASGEAQCIVATKEVSD